MPRTYSYVTVDVFTVNHFEGNPLAVFTDGSGLDTATMQRIAGELNLSETTFVLPPADPANTAKVRIFTPGQELQFAGHPTLGTSFVIRSGDATELILEEGVGPVPVRVTSTGGVEQFWLTTPPITFGERFDPAPVAKALGLGINDIRPDTPPEAAGAGGPTFLYVGLRNREAVDRIALLDYRMLAAELPNAPSEVFAFATLEESDGEPGDTYSVYSRMFAPAHGIAEDPATGSATGPLAAYMIRHGLLPLMNGLRMVSEQGTKMGRRSFLHVLVHVDDDNKASIEVGGSVVPIARGEMTLP